MKSKITGELNPCDYDEELFESEPISIPYFDNKKLKISFIDAKYEPYLIESDKVLERFLTKDCKNRMNDSEIVYEYYSQILKLGYCADLKLSSITDIWEFVNPNEIIIDWEDECKYYLCVSCGCSWEEEHGLQLVFINGESLTRASGHDGHYED
jgi:hypothetical protein